MLLSELENEVWQCLQELGHHAKVVRVCMKQKEKVCCALHGYSNFFSAMYWVYNNFLVIRICRMTDEKNKKGVTMGRWLKEGIAQQSSSLKAAKIQKVLDDYDALRKTTQYKHIRTIRNKSYAHYDQDRKKAEKLASSTWLDVFEMIEKLQRVYDAAAVAGLTTSTTWAMEMPDNGTAVLLQRIEQICHQDAKHERLVREMNPSAGSAS